jgi:beta-glucosidase
MEGAVPCGYAAVLEAWYTGEEGGRALADILLGDVNPSGRLPISFPRSAGHIPCCYNHKPSAWALGRTRGTPEDPGSVYVFSPREPLYPFGYGLSYTTFAYEDLRVMPGSLPVSALQARQPGVAATGRVAVSVTVSNTGSRAGDEVALLYVADDVCSVTPFVKRLRGFRRIHLEPGASREVSFELSFADFSFIDRQMKEAVEPGTFTLSIGGLEAAFTLTP